MQGKVTILSLAAISFRLHYFIFASYRRRNELNQTTPVRRMLGSEPDLQAHIQNLAVFPLKLAAQNCLYSTVF